MSHVNQNQNKTHAHITVRLNCWPFSFDRIEYLSNPLPIGYPHMFVDISSIEIDFCYDFPMGKSKVRTEIGWTQHSQSLGIFNCNSWNNFKTYFSILFYHFLNFRLKKKSFKKKCENSSETLFLIKHMFIFHIDMIHRASDVVIFIYYVLLKM